MSTSTLEPAAHVEHHDDTPLDLHDLHMRNSACGYERELTLPTYKAQSVAARLRGIRAISAVLITDSSPEIELGDYIHFGLIEAISCLADGIITDIEWANSRANREVEA